MASPLFPLKRAGIPLILVALLAACSKNNDQSTASASAPAAAVAPAQTPDGDPTVAREAARPLAEYTQVELDRVTGQEAMDANDAAIRAMYWSRAARDNALLAYDFLPAYRKERDTFKRDDVLKAGQQQLDAAYQSAQGHVLYAIHQPERSAVLVGRYDKAQNGFVVALGSTGYIWEFDKPNESNTTPPPAWGMALLGVEKGARNAAQIYYHPKDEAEARAIEGKLSSIGDANSSSEYLPSVYLAHTVKSVIGRDWRSSPTAYLVVDAIVVLNPKDKTPLFTIDRRDLGDAIPIIKDEQIEALGLPKPKRAPNARYM